MGIGSQIRLVGTIIIPEDQQARLVPLLEQHTRLTLCEPGCIEFEISQDRTHPAVFHVRELFDDQVAFDVHQARGAASDWGTASQGLQRDFKKTVL